MHYKLLELSEHDIPATMIIQLSEEVDEIPYGETTLLKPTDVRDLEGGWPEIAQSFNVYMTRDGTMYLERKSRPDFRNLMDDQLTTCSERCISYRDYGGDDGHDYADAATMLCNQMLQIHYDELASSSDYATRNDRCLLALLNLEPRPWAQACDGVSPLIWEFIESTCGEDPNYEGIPPFESIPTLGDVPQYGDQ
jgi:hypothetical protein